MLHYKTVIAEVCRFYGIDRCEMMSRKRRKDIVVPRQAAMAFIYWYCKKSMLEIGRLFDRDHTTVLHAEKAVNKKISEGDQDVFELVARLDSMFDKSLAEREQNAIDFLLARNKKLAESQEAGSIKMFDFSGDNLNVRD